MKKFFRLSVFLAAAALLALAAGCLSANPSASAQGPKYVFLFIGDGMGKPHVDLGRQLFGKLNMDEFPVRGSVSTVNASRGVTDSAASGTAYACGVKTSNGRLGIDAEGKNVESCAVLAKRQGRRVAILTTVGVNNATPAAFYAHVMTRGESRTIMDQFPASGIDILAGNGIDGMRKAVKPEDFLTGKAYRTGGAAAGDAGAARAKGIRVIEKDDAPFFALKTPDLPVVVYSAGMRDLGDYVRKSIELMKDCPAGFFMMAEGGQIDHGGHHNDGQYMLRELKEFDAAVGAAYDFYLKHPAETLIVVSADHHTGGLVLSGRAMKDYPDLSPENLKIKEKDSADEAVKKLAARGIVCTDAEKASLEQAVKKQKNCVRAVRRLIDARSGISWKTTGHTADEVYLFAVGAGAEAFAGHQENSDVGRRLKEALQAGR